ncbi:MAG: LysE family translocator [Alphaproteobacteria bacterium]|nr:LysE family translocator [Alphaproteobacteria bacterium]
MPPEQILAFALFTLAAAGTPGPSNVLLTATGAQVGVLRGLPTWFGVSAGMGLMMAIVGYGLGAAVLDQPMVLKTLNWVGGGFLLWLAWKIAIAPRASGDDDQRPVGFFGAVAFQWVNPKSWIVSASASGTFLNAAAGDALTQAVAFGAIFALVSLPACFPWLMIGVAVRRWLATDRAHRIFNVSMALVLAGSVALILV